MLILGEVHTGLLQHSTSLTAGASEDLLELCRGERVRRFERPIAAAASPELLTGVDCRLPTASGLRSRGVGTVRHRAIIVGGHLLQGSAVAVVAKGEADRRLPWSHYLARPGQIETIGRTDWTDVARGFAAASPDPSALDLRAICGRVVDAVQASPQLDRVPPFRSTRTRLRWVAVLTDGDSQPGQMAFGVEGRALRTLRLSCAEPDATSVVGFCEDLARHDWLLTTLLEVIERSRIGAVARIETLSRLQPAIDHLLHLWMPGARADEAVAQWWEGLEQRSGFSRQWQVSVNRIRDQLAISTMALLREAARAGSDD